MSRARTPYTARASMGRAPRHAPCIHTANCRPLSWRVPQEVCIASRPMAMVGLGQPVAIHQGTVAHTGSNPEDYRNSTSMSVPRVEQAGPESVVQVGHRPGEVA